MSALRQLAYITEQEYRDGEEISPIKHEWLDGEVFAMAGGTFNHSTLCSKVAAAADRALRGRPCRARNSEQRIKIESDGQETYPDAVIFCPPSRFVGRGDSTLLTPKIVFEVLSVSAEKYDRTGKFAIYKTIDTFEEYVLIEQDRVWVDHFRRDQNGNWIHRAYISRADVLRLESVGIEIALDDIYDELDVPDALLHFEMAPEAN